MYAAHTQVRIEFQLSYTRESVHMNIHNSDVSEGTHIGKCHPFPFTLYYYFHSMSCTPLSKNVLCVNENKNDGFDFDHIINYGITT